MRWRIASVHLSLSGAERQAHLAELWPAVELDGQSPLVVAGDVNEEPNQPVWAELSSRLVDAWAVTKTGAGNTFSATAPSKRIDGIFVGSDLEVVECRVADDVPGVQAASDHLPVLAVLRHQSPAGDA